MLAQKLILGLGFALLVPMLVHQGIELVRPEPDYKQYQVQNYSERYRAALPEERVRLDAEKRRLDDLRETAQKRWSKFRFLTGALIGMAVTLIGAFIAVPAVSNGFMAGGLFTFMGSCGFYWMNMSQSGRFFLLLGVFGVLLWIGYQKLSELKQAKQSLA